MSTRYEMHIRVKSDPTHRWLYYDGSETIEGLDDDWYRYKCHPLYDAKISEIKTIKESTGE